VVVGFHLQGGHLGIVEKQADLAGPVEVVNLPLGKDKIEFIAGHHFLGIGNDAVDSYIAHPAAKQEEDQHHRKTAGNSGVDGKIADQGGKTGRLLHGLLLLGGAGAKGLAATWVGKFRSR